MSRRPKSSQSVALFPFLAVLVCTMGSLIFLLLVTTRMIRDRATPAGLVEAATPPLPLMSVDASPAPLFESPVASPPAAPTILDQEPATPPEDIRAMALEKRLQEQESLNALWNARVHDLTLAREERARLIAQRQQLQKAAAQKISAMQTELQELETQLGRLTGELTATSTDTGSSKERIELEAHLRDLKRRLRAAQQSQGDNKFEVVPYDAVSGTSRRPILIECTAEGLRFIPEDVTIKRGDLNGFSQKVNPIVIGASALVNYWTAWNIRQENPAQEPEPYVLLLVRPSGTIAYYVAMDMLHDLHQPHGYELLEEDTELQMPPVDSGAKAALETAVSRLIAERDQIMRQTGMSRFGPARGAGGSGSGNGGGRAGSPMTGAGGPAGTGPGAGGSGNADQFELSDILGKDDPGGSQNWDRVENFEGPRRGGNSGGGSGGGGLSPSRTASAGGPAGGPAGNSRTAKGVGSGNSSGRFAVAAGGKQVESPGEPGDVNSGSAAAGDRTRSPEARGGAAAKPGTVPVAGNDDGSGIEALEETDADPTSDRKGRPGTNSKPDTGLGSNGNRSIPVEDHRQNKRKSTDREGPTGPEQLAHHHWGLTEPGASIGLEREVRIDIEPKRYVIGKKHAVSIGEKETRDETFAKIVTVLDLQARDWGLPPKGFFWKPSLRYVIADGGDANYDRVQSLLERAGLSSTREFASEHRAAETEKAPAEPPTVAPQPAPPAPKPSRRVFRGILR